MILSPTIVIILATTCIKARLLLRITVKFHHSANGEKLFDSGGDEDGDGTCKRTFTAY